MAVLDIDKNGPVSKLEFDVWYREQLTHVVKTPYDNYTLRHHELQRLRWFMQVLWLKTLINVR
jgi:hypothetical protein